ncbi:MAG: class I SAM-dependent methyltransferase [Chloroflexia bacterium]
MNLQELLENPPEVHMLPDGEPNPVGLAGEVLKFLFSTLVEEATTLETGAGLSTIAFAMRGCNHTCIAPFQYEVDGIKAFCLQHSISTEKVNFIVERSENVLPGLTCPPLDLALIDGSHGFPVQFLDWFYMAPLLKIGGLLILDDTQLWTGHVLKQFLQTEPEWKFEREFYAKTAVFTRLQDGSNLKDWYDQPYVVRHSAKGIASAIRRGGREARIARARAGLRLLLNGDLATLRRKLGKRK